VVAGQFEIGSIMTLPPRKCATNTRGKPFTKGNAGKPPGTRHRVTRAIEELLEGEADALTRKAIEKALEGDMTALRLCLDRLVPPRRDSPISMTLPPITTAADTVTASATLLDAVATGDVTPDEAGRVMALLTAHRTLIETADLAARVAALEERK
jgi:hypothetical protein